MKKYSFYIKDDNEENVYFKDIRILKNHIQKEHADGTTLHEDRGHYFTININFRNKINRLIKNATKQLRN